LDRIVFKIFYSILVCSSFLQIEAFAGTFTTTGTPGTWAEGGSPGADDDLVIEHDWSGYNSGLGYSYGVLRGSLTISSGGYFKIAGSMVVRGNADVEVSSGGNLEVTGSFDINGGGSGTFNFDGDIDTDGAVINGASLTGSGNWTFSSTFTNNGDINGYTDNPSSSPFNLATLPVEWLSFNVILKENNTNEASWCTASEINNETFYIERSTDGILFEEIGTVPGAGNSYTEKCYTFRDQNSPASALIYYRIKQVDFDGKFDYSKILSVAVANDVSVFFNSNSNQLNLHFRNLRLSEASIYSMNGQLIYQSYLSAENQRTIPIKTSTIPYIIVNLIFENGRVYRKKIFLD
jgi:hypothetical protein